MISVLITINHVINKYDTEILLYVGEEFQKRKIIINNDKMIYMNEEKYDMTIIKIDEKDNIMNYLELDDNIINDILNNDVNNTNDKYNHH